MGTCTITYKANGGTGEDWSSEVAFKEENDIYLADFTLSSNTGIGSFSWAKHRLRAWQINYIPDGSGTAEYDLGESLTIKSLTDASVSYDANAVWEDLVTLTYTAYAGDRELEVEYNRNQDYYYPSLGSIPLAPPLLADKAYRFDHWECNGRTVNNLNASEILADLSKDSVEIRAICYSITKIAIYGREIPEVATASELREQYVLLANSLKANDARKLVGTKLSDFYNNIHSFKKVVYAEPFASISTDSQVTEIYLSASQNDIKLNLYSPVRADSLVIIHVDRGSLFDEMSFYIQLSDAAVETFTEVSPTLSGVTDESTIVIYTDSDSNTVYELYKYPVANIRNYIEELFQKYYLPVSYTTTEYVNFLWGSSLDVDGKDNGKIVTTFNLTDSTTELLYKTRDVQISLDENVLNNGQYTDDEIIKIRRFYSLTCPAVYKMDLGDPCTLSVIYDYITSDDVLTVTSDIKHDNVPIKVVAL